MNRPKALTGIKGNIKYRNIWGFDTEDNTKGEMIYGSFYDGKNFYGFKTPHDVMDLSRKISDKYGKTKIHLAATNLEYDMNNAFKGYYDRIDIMYGMKLINFRVKESNIYAFDTLNHYKESVAKQGERLGLNKIKYKFTPESLKYSQKLIDYNHQDSLITRTSAVEFQKAVNEFGAEMRDTIAGTSLNLFRRRFLPFEINSTPDDVLDFLKQGYYGGRCEIINFEGIADETGDILYYDINSLYPDVMSNNDFPDPNSRVMNQKSIDAEGVSECDIEVFDTYLPYLPYKMQLPDKTFRLMFPIGKLHGCWSNFELRYALEHKLIKIHKIYKSVNYTKSGPYFKPYMEFMYNQRMRYPDRNSPMNQAAKLFMNSLYGKFFEHVDSEGLLCDSGGIIEISKKENYYPVHTNGIWSIHTTAKARTKLYEGAQAVIKKHGEKNLYYYDTDSLMYKGRPGVLDEGKKIGQWKLEGKFKYAKYYLPKTYLMVDENNEAKITAKGIPLDKETEDIQNIVLNGFGGYDESFKIPLKFKYRLDFIQGDKVMINKPVKFKESYRLLDYKNKQNVWREVPRRMIQAYSKRRVNIYNETLPIKRKDF